MFNKKTDYTTGASASMGKRKFVLFGVIAGLIVIAIVISLTASGSNGEGSFGRNSLNTYDGDEYNINYPDGFTSSDITAGQEFKSEEAGSFTVTKFSPRLSTLTIDSLKALATQDSNDQIIASVSTKEITVNNNDALQVTNKATGTEMVYVIGDSAVWLLQYNPTKGESLEKNTKPITNSFTLKKTDL